MKLYLIDADTIMYFLKGDERVVNRFSEVDITRMYISDITCARLYHGAYKPSKPKYSLRIMNSIINNFNIASINLEATKVYGRLKVESKNKKDNMSDMDLLTAAVAIAGNYIFVTNNIEGFYSIKELILENWSVESSQQE